MRELKPIYRFKYLELKKIECLEVNSLLSFFFFFLQFMLQFESYSDDSFKKRFMHMENQVTLK